MSRRPFASVMATPVAKLGLLSDETALTGLCWLPNSHASRPPSSDFLKSVHCALKDYFQNGQKLPPVALNLKGTPFQLKVWNALMEIPMGTVTSYGNLAKLLNTSSRAVGQACKSNPVVLFVPCHRVVSSTGIGGYMGKQNKLNIKQWLLHHEGAKWQ